MKLLKYTLLSLTFAVTVQNKIEAQNYQDLLRYSEKFYQSTARASGAGNAFGALGSDPLSMSINPAGIGLYRSSEVTFSAAITRPRSVSSYLGLESTDDKYNLNVGNAAVIFANVREKNGKPATSGWVAVNWGLGFNRTNSFHRRVFMEGVNTNSSILENFAENAKGRSHDDLVADEFSYSALAYQAFLIDPVPFGSTNYIGAHSYDNLPVNVIQQDEIATRGAMNDINVAVSGNYSNKLYVGAGVNFPTIGYHHIRTFTEQNNNTSDSLYYKSSKLYEEINTSGIGISANFGAIYRAFDFLRVGASVSLPSFYSLKDDYNYGINSERLTSDGEVFLSKNSPIGEYRYNIVTPWRATASTAFIVNKAGFISLDYEFVDYSDSRINSDFEGARNTNVIVQRYFKPNGNVRIGTEWKYDAFAFRGGFGYYGSPFKEGLTPDNFDGSSRMYSLGVGYRDSDAFIDISYQLRQSKYFHLPYEVKSKDVEGASVQDNRSNIMLTVGARF